MKQLKEMAQRLSLTQKISLGLAVALVVAVIGYAVTTAGATEYRPLFSGLNPEDAGRIAAKLKEQKVLYKVGDDNGTLYVPADKVNDLRIQLASEGLPQSSRIGFELFDQTNFGATEFSEQIKYQRALEGELERTIASIGEVERVRVHVVLPRESFFRDREEKAKASVTLKLKSNRRLPEASVNGIVNLVANSVQGLAPEQVSVIDTQGRLLARPGEQDGELKLTSSQVELRERMEKELGHRLLGLLEPVVGEGKVRVSVAAELDFARNERVEEKYDPQATALRSEQKMEERESKDAVAGGIAGTRSNQPPPEAAKPETPPPTGPGRFKSSQTTNYEVTRTTTRTVDPAGDIKRLSVSVVVDNGNKIEGEGAAAKQVTVKRTPEEIEQIRQAVLGAIGIDEKRGDQLIVQNLAFGNPLEEPAAPQLPLAKRLMQDPEMIKTLLRYAVPVVLVLLAYLLLVRPVKKALMPKKAKAEPAKLEGPVHALPTGVEKVLAGGDAPRTVEELEAELQTEPEVEVARVTKTDIIKARLREKMQKDPESMAQLVRAWLREGATVNNNGD